eukprot:639817-Rhodomonas_salina.5
MFLFQPAAATTLSASHEHRKWRGSIGIVFIPLLLFAACSVSESAKLSAGLGMQSVQYHGNIARWRLRVGVCLLRRY